jgi:hypothetical protein
VKIRVVSTLALAGALAFSATGCSLVAPVATDKVYAQSDGVNADVESLDVRNLMLISGQAGDPYNVVFTAVNTKNSELPLTMSFVSDDGDTETASTQVKPGSTLYGQPSDEQDMLVVDLGDQHIGTTVTAYLETSTGKTVKTEVPVLDGTLNEYKDYVVTASEFKDLKKKASDDSVDADNPEVDEEKAESNETN